MPGTPAPRRWLFLGVLVNELTEPGAPVAVAEAIVPEGASPPAHVHAALDDSFYILDGHMVIHCGDDVWQAGPGSWVQFPVGVPHTFRVLGGPAGSCSSMPTTASWPRCARSAARPPAPTSSTPPKAPRWRNWTGRSPLTASPTSARRWNRPRPSASSANWPVRLSPTGSDSSEVSTATLAGCLDLPGSPLGTGISDLYVEEVRVQPAR